MIYLAYSICSSFLFRKFHFYTHSNVTTITWYIIGITVKEITSKTRAKDIGMWIVEVFELMICSINYYFLRKNVIQVPRYDKYVPPHVQGSSLINRSILIWVLWIIKVIGLSLNYNVLKTCLWIDWACDAISLPFSQGESESKAFSSVHFLFYFVVLLLERYEQITHDIVWCLILASTFFIV